MSECGDCGRKLQDPRDKNASGWWRDECLDCLGTGAVPVLADGGWSSTGRERQLFAVVKTADGAFRAWQPHSAHGEEMAARGQSPAEAIARYAALYGDFDVVPNRGDDDE